MVYKCCLRSLWCTQVRVITCYVVLALSRNRVVTGACAVREDCIVCLASSLPTWCVCGYAVTHDRHVEYLQAVCSGILYTCEACGGDVW